MEDEVEYEKRRSKRCRKRCLVTSLIIFIFLLLAALIIIIALVIVPLLTKEDSRDFRLSSNVIPDHYSVEIQPYLIPDNFTFDGSVNISVKCTSPTKEIVLHSHKLKINDVNIKSMSSDANPKIQKRELDTQKQLLILKIANNLEKDKMYQIQINFSGVLNQQPEGFFWRSYTEGKEEKYIAATNFKPTYARQAFPCFDEPSLKATFDILIVRRDNEKSLSNKPRTSTRERPNGWKVDVYETSAKMSTYLISFFVGNFADIKGEAKPIQMSVWTRPDQINKAKFALETATDIFNKALSISGFPNLQPKLDILALPMEEKLFYSGTEGTMGLMMMDEAELLYDEKEDEDSSEYIKKHVARNIANHIAHQFFGNIVTPKWWDDAWLIESLAHHFATLTLNELFKRWKWIEEEVIQMNDHFLIDCLDYSKPLSKAVDKASKVPEIPEYLIIKGVRVLRMVQMLIGEKQFQTEMFRFLKSGAYGSVTQKEFWEHMNQNGDNKVNLESVVDSWINNIGHPLITVNRHYQKRTANISQMSCQEKSSNLWTIPITMRLKKDGRIEIRKIWLNSTHTNIENMPKKKNDSYIFNAEQSAFYRVNYDNENWKALAEKLRRNHEDIPALGRYQLLDDASKFIFLDMSKYGILLDLMLYLPKEKEEFVLSFLGKIKISEFGKSVRRQIPKIRHKYIGYITEPIFDKHLTSLNKRHSKHNLLTDWNLIREVIAGACMNDNDDCIKMAIAKFNDIMANKTQVTKLDSVVMRTVLCAAVRKGDTDTYNELEAYYEKLKKDGKPVEDFLYALGCTEQLYRLNSFIENIVILGDQNPGPAIESILNNKNWLHLFPLLKENWVKLEKNFVRTQLIFRILGEAVSNTEELQEMDKLYHNIKKDDLSKDQMKILEKHLKNAEETVASREKNINQMVTWLTTWNKS